MVAGKRIEKAEGVDRYASMSFKNATRGKNRSALLSCVPTVFQIQIHIRKKLLFTTSSTGVLCTSPYENVNTLQSCRYEDARES